MNESFFQDESDPNCGCNAGGNGTPTNPDYTTNPVQNPNAVYVVVDWNNIVGRPPEFDTADSLLTFVLANITPQNFNDSAEIDFTYSAPNVTAVLKTTGVAAGIYKSVTVDAKGRVTTGTNPTTLSGFGITNAYTKTEVDGLLNLETLATVTARGAVTASPIQTGGIDALGFCQLGTGGSIVTVSGNDFNVDSADCNISDGLPTLNYTQTGPDGVTTNGGISGITIGRGSLDEAWIVWDEAFLGWKAGTSGLLRPLAYREDTPTNNWVAVWEAANNRFKTVDPSTIAGGSYIQNQTSSNQTGGARVSGAIYAVTGFRAAGPTLFYSSGTFGTQTGILGPTSITYNGVSSTFMMLSGTNTASINGTYLGASLISVTNLAGQTTTAGIYAKKTGGIEITDADVRFNVAIPTGTLADTVFMKNITTGRLGEVSSDTIVGGDIMVAGQQTSSSDPTKTLASYTTASDRSYTAIGKVTARNTANGDSATYWVYTKVRNVGGVMTVSTVADVTTPIEDASMTTGSVTIDNSGTDIRLRYSPPASTTVSVRGRLQIQKDS